MKKKFISTNMKIFLLILFILSITLYASGCITLAQSGYKLSDYSNELHIKPNAFNFKFDFNDSSVSSNYTLNDNINEININLNSQGINVINYDGQDLKVQIKSNNTISSELTKIETGNKLTLNSKYDTPSDSTISVSIPYSFKDRGILKIITSSGDIDVSNLALNTLSLSTASGDINGSNLNQNYLYLNSSSGDIKFNTTTITETKFAASSGSIIGSGTLGAITGNTSSGDINLQIKGSLNNASLSTASGSVDLVLPKNSGYKVNYETVSGDLESHNKELSFGDESSIININTVSGDLKIN